MLGKVFVSAESRVQVCLGDVRSLFSEALTNR